MDIFVLAILFLINNYFIVKTYDKEISMINQKIREMRTNINEMEKDINNLEKSLKMKEAVDEKVNDENKEDENKKNN